MLGQHKKKEQHAREAEAEEATCRGSRSRRSIMLCSRSMQKEKQE
jgi:hypothetical protein